MNNAMTWGKLLGTDIEPTEARPFKVLRTAKFWCGYAMEITLASERGSYRVIHPDYTESFRGKGARARAEAAYAARLIECVTAYGEPMPA